MIIPVNSYSRIVCFIGEGMVQTIYIYIYIRVGQKKFFAQNMVRKLPKHVHIDNK